MIHICFTSLQLSSRIFWILVKFYSNSCKCSDTWLTEQPQLTVISSESSYFSNSWLNFLLSTRLITWPSRLLWTQSATQSTGSVVYLVDGIIDSIQQQQVPESLIQLLLPSHRRSNLRSECLSCMYNWHLDINLCIKKIKIIIIMMIMTINRPSANNRASVVCNRVHQLITTTTWFELHYTVHVHV